MQVCKLFLKILKKNKFMFILYFCIFTLICIFMIKSQNTSMNYQEQKIVAAIAIEEESEEADAFLTFLESYIERVELQGGQSVSDALFWDDIDLYIYLPSDFYEKIILGEEGIEYESSPDSLEAVAFLSTINSYLNTLRESVRLNLCSKEEAFTYTTKLFNDNTVTHIELTAKESTGKIRGVFDLAVYVVCALILSIVGIISFEMRTIDINRRLRISSYSTGKRNIMLAVCYLVFSVLFIGVIACIAILLFPNQISIRLLYYIINAIFFALIAVLMALFLSSLFKSDMAYSCLSNALPLAIAFLCGCFISLELLPESTKIFAHIFPQLYIVMANQYIQTTTSFNFIEYLKIIWPCFLFIFIFLGGSILITNHIAKSEN